MAIRKSTIFRDKTLPTIDGYARSLKNCWHIGISTLQAQQANK
jgi:hypothetical protein